jgi:hypothetical protein
VQNAVENIPKEYIKRRLKRSPKIPLTKRPYLNGCTFQFQFNSMLIINFDLICLQMRKRIEILNH